MDDFLKLKVGTILDIITAQINQRIEDEERVIEKKNNKKEEVRTATKSDDIMSFF